MRLSAPHPGLLRAYGNEQEYFAKTAGELPVSTRVVMGLLAADRSLARQNQRKQTQMSQEEVAQILRAIELAKMEQARGAAEYSRARPFLHAPPPNDSRYGYPRDPALWYGDQLPVGMDGGMVRLASVICAEVGADMAKQAGLVDSFRAAGGALKGLGSKVQNTVQQSIGKLQAGAEKSLQGLKVKPQGAAPTGPITPPTPTQPPKPTAAPQMANTVSTPKTPEVPPAPPAPPTQGAPTPNRFSLRGLAGAGAVLGAGYLGMKAFNKGLDVLGGESHPERYGVGGPQMAYGLNQYGQPQLGTPFQY